MKKPYQIEAQRAVRPLEEMAADGNPAVQLALPMAEMVGWRRQGVGALIRQATCKTEGFAAPIAAQLRLARVAPTMTELEIGFVTACKWR